MPPLPSIRLHTRSPIDPGVFSLKREAYLLIESCHATTTEDLYEDKDWKGRLYISATSNPQLRWSVTAKARARGGLANYHPGLPLSRHALSFLNADMNDLPFLFKNNTGVLFYESPSYDPPPGGLPAVSFTIALKFGEYDPTRFGSSVPTGLVNSFGPATETGAAAPWTGHPVSLYYLRPGTGVVSRVFRIAPRRPTLAECVAHFDSLADLTAWQGGVRFWQSAEDGFFTDRAFPPQPETWSHMDTSPAFAGAFDHRDNVWIGSAVPGITPETSAIPRLIWFALTYPVGPFLYLQDPAALRPPAVAAVNPAAPVSAAWDWSTSGWTGDGAPFVRDAYRTPYQIDSFNWPLP